MRNAGRARPKKLLQHTLKNTAVRDHERITHTTHHNYILLFQAKIETKALKAKRPGFTDDRYNETSYYVENGTAIIILDENPMFFDS